MYVPTIKDVAKAANVSVATVSRVLHNLSGYSDKTKQKVLQAIEELGYHPNAIARGLINKRTQTIGVLFPNVSSGFSSEILHGIEEVAHEKGFSVIVCNTAEDGKRTMKYLQVLREKQVDGIVFTSEVLKDEYYQALKEMSIPVVLVNTQSHKHMIPYVKVDDRQAAYQATAYLIEKGHREIAMISGHLWDPIAGAPRMEGYRQALEDHGIEFLESRVAYGDFHWESGRRAMESLLAEAPSFTALFAASDEMAIGAMGAVFEKGMRIPDDLSIIGYDDLTLSKSVFPPLTTIHQPLAQIGCLASDKLIALIEDSQNVSSSIVSHHIVERQTVRSKG
ncbi:substrate-binding domain-containing protein [Paenibacillus sp. HJL G12]|uniref:Substrate-binding domain-containing protein n=1 Tax=Paenibacillus dendrobii TaxID=2691084 RepID=A0A7X3IF57_9BACL|nr:LacI family DNA-binding transcriptional regulator [Paenibacillus dendrobii]MWV42181.1 substrate-binding domain-containing protein [Paenibacillus dendrobii]